MKPELEFQGRAIAHMFANGQIEVLWVDSFVSVVSEDNGEIGKKLPVVENLRSEYSASKSPEVL